MTGRELCIVDSMTDVMVEVGFVRSGGGKVDRIGYRCDSGRRRYRARVSYVIGLALSDDVLIART